MDHMAKRTDLGWGIVGIVDPYHSENDPIGISHRIVTKEIPLVAQDFQNPVMFSLKTKVKEVISSDILRLMEQNLVDPVLNSVPNSQEDKKFLSILENGVKFQDGHYVLPLPFRSKNPSLPNNKIVALRRLKTLT